MMTVRWLQPFCKKGVTGALMMMHNEEIHAYVYIFGCGGLLAVLESLVSRQVFTRVEINEAYYYSIPSVAGYLETPGQGE
jgi:hypothetical protein